MQMLIENAQAMNDANYSKFMAYAAQLRKDKKKREADHVHKQAQQLNRYFYSVKHTDKTDMILYYNRQMQVIVQEVSEYIKEA